MGVARDGDLRVLLAVSADVHLEDPVEPLALGAHEPLVAFVVVGIEDGEQIRREAWRVRVVDRELGGDVHTPLLPREEAAQGVERAGLCPEVAIALGRGRFGLRDLAR